MEKISFKTISGFLNTSQNKVSKAFSYLGLGIGVFLLLISVQLYININYLLKNKNSRNDGFDYISITKTITNENMGNDNRFTIEEIEAIKNQPFIEDASPLTGNQFRAKASAGRIIPFSTDLFLESVKTDFIDTVPPGFSWQPGQQDVPIIFSSDFLEMYNVFAPAQDLPQLSDKSIGTINIILECYGPSGIQNFTGRIVAVSDRINSVLVPESFLVFANKAFGNSVNPPSARVYLKTKDANNTELISYLDQQKYHVNKDKTKFGRVKQILQTVVTGLGAFSILVILLAMMLFSFYLQLMIARSKDNLQLLMTLGYSPNWLSKTVAAQWIKAYAMIITSALVVCAGLQVIMRAYVVNGTEKLSPILDIRVIVLAILLLILCVILNYRLIRKSLRQL